MKKNVFVGLLATMLTFCFIGCDNGTTPTGSGNGNGGEGTPMISGKFASQTGTGDAVFYADYVSNARSVSRAVGGMATTEKELTGKIEDGDIIFNLKGVYNTADNKFYLSAGSSMLIYQIAGTLTAGNLAATEAAVKVKDGEDWTIHTVSVAAASEVEIAGAASSGEESGIPSAWFGRWTTGETDYVLTAFQMAFSEFPEDPAGLLDTVAVITGQKYETVWQAYAYYLGPEGEVLSKELTFVKLLIEADDANLKLTLYMDSMSDTYADAKAYVITGSSQSDSIILTRPN